MFYRYGLYVETINPRFSVGTFLHKEFGCGLIKGLNRYQRLTGTTVFERLCKIGNIKDR